VPALPLPRPRLLQRHKTWLTFLSATQHLGNLQAKGFGLTVRVGGKMDTSYEPRFCLEPGLWLFPGWESTLRRLMIALGTDPKLFPRNVWSQYLQWYMGLFVPDFLSPPVPPSCPSGKQKCFLYSPFYGKACRWAMLGELKPEGPKVSPEAYLADRKLFPRKDAGDSLHSAHAGLIRGNCG